jgi:hypothetical protein
MKWAAYIMVLFFLSSLSSASGPAQIIKNVICGLAAEVRLLAGVLATLMFIYGGAKYAYSADDPGARKQAKNIAVGAIIGAIIVASAGGLVTAIAGGGCP